MKTRRISTICRHGARENVNMSLINVMQALVNLQADTCERCVDAMAPSHAKMNVVAYRSRLTLVKLKLQRAMEKLRRGGCTERYIVRH